MSFNLCNNTPTPGCGNDYFSAFNQFLNGGLSAGKVAISGLTLGVITNVAFKRFGFSKPVTFIATAIPVSVAAIAALKAAFGVTLGALPFALIIQAALRR